MRVCVCVRAHAHGVGVCVCVCACARTCWGARERAAFHGCCCPGAAACAVFGTSGHVKDFISDHIAPLFMAKDLERGIGPIFDRIMNVELLISIAIGFAFIAGAVFFRSKADEL